MALPTNSSSNKSYSAGKECIMYNKTYPIGLAEHGTEVVHQGKGYAISDFVRNPTCNYMTFQPGYWVSRIPGTKDLTWHDHCTGRQWNAKRSTQKMDTVLANDNCPVKSQSRDIWVSFFGDSVTRDLLGHFWEKGSNNSYPSNVKEWKTKNNTQAPDMLLARFGSESEGRIWLSYKFHFMTKETQELAIGYSWQEFLRGRGEGPRDDDPYWQSDRVPDVVFYSPGYHASSLNSSAFGGALEGILRKWEQWNRENNATMPRMHLMLNMMPAPWLIPEKYSEDRQFRTLLNEYRKNLAIIDIANKFGFIQSAVDFFSMELPFNGHNGALSAHRDAVHITGTHPVIRIQQDLILNSLCNLTTR